MKYEILSELHWDWHLYRVSLPLDSPVWDEVSQIETSLESQLEAQDEF